MLPSSTPPRSPGKYLKKKIGRVLGRGKKKDGDDGGDDDDPAMKQHNDGGAGEEDSEPSSRHSRSSRQDRRSIKSLSSSRTTNTADYYYEDTAMAGLSSPSSAAASPVAAAPSTPSFRRRRMLLGLGQRGQQPPPLPQDKKKKEKKQPSSSSQQLQRGRRPQLESSDSWLRLTQHSGDYNDVSNDEVVGINDTTTMLVDDVETTDFADDEADGDASPKIMADEQDDQLKELGTGKKKSSTDNLQSFASRPPRAALRQDSWYNMGRDDKSVD